MQIRKWIRNHEALRAARPTAKLVLKGRLRKGRPPTPLPSPSEDSSDTESLSSSSHANIEPPAKIQPSEPQSASPTSTESAQATYSTPQPPSPREHEDLVAAEDLLSLLFSLPPTRADAAAAQTSFTRESIGANHPC